MARPIILEGVVSANGQTIHLDERSCLPDGYRVKVELILTPDEALNLACGSWSELTEEEIADLEDHLSRMRGRPVKLRDEEDAA